MPEIFDLLAYRQREESGQPRKGSLGNLHLDFPPLVFPLALGGENGYLDCPNSNNNVGFIRRLFLLKERNQQ